MAKPTIDRAIYKEIKYWTTLKNPKEKMMEYLNSVKPVTKRTKEQNNALHKNFQIIAEKLNDAGYSVQSLVRFDIPFDVYEVKERLWKKIQQAMTGKESTTDLDKWGEIEKIHEVLMRELGEKKGIEYHEFPHDPEKRKEFEDRLKAPDVDYPENNLGETPF